MSSCFGSFGKAGGVGVSASADGGGGNSRKDISVEVGLSIVCRNVP